MTGWSTLIGTPGIVNQVNDDDLVFFCLPVTILIFEKALRQEITENKLSILQPVNALFIFHLN